MTPDHLLPCSRRTMLRRCGLGLGALALGPLVGAPLTAGEPGSSLAAKKPHFAPKATRLIHIFANGGPSHVDSFDPKPLLATFAGKSLPIANLKTERPTGAAFPSPFAFKRHGKCGMEISELFPYVAEHADDLCVIRSMHADVPNHEPSLLLMNCGESRLVRPSLGSWLTYGLGSENQNLPGFVAMCPGGMPIQESQNWQSGFLPGIYQGTYLDTKHSEVEKLIEHIVNRRQPRAAQRDQLDLLAELNRRHAAARQADAQIDARIQNFELAYRMQMEASDVFDLAQEPKTVRDRYGDGVQGRQLLMTRRLIERGVRVVQVWHGAGQPWDNHDDLEVNHRKLAKESDQAIGALLGDLKERGLLDETLVLWGGEFGRTPVVEMPKPGSNSGKINGRDHNHHGFTMWLAGGGVKGGHIHGATDEFGFKAVADPVHIHDLHATMLHLFGYDHERFTYRYAGRDFRLTDVHGHVVKQILR